MVLSRGAGYSFAEVELLSLLPPLPAVALLEPVGDCFVCGVLFLVAVPVALGFELGVGVLGDAEALEDGFVACWCRAVARIVKLRGVRRWCRLGPALRLLRRRQRGGWFWVR